MAEIKCRIITTEEWRKAIIQLWDWNEDYHWVPLFHNAMGLVQYTGAELFERLIVFPIQVEVDGVPAGWVKAWNISDTHVRIQGFYVKPEFRGLGLFFKLYEYACSLWPTPWAWSVQHCRADTLSLYRDKLGCTLIGERHHPDSPTSYVLVKKFAYV